MEPKKLILNTSILCPNNLCSYQLHKFKILLVQLKSLFIYLLRNFIIKKMPNTFDIYNRKNVRIASSTNVILINCTTVNNIITMVTKNNVLVTF